LWDRNFSSTSFGTYDSPTLNNKAVEVGGAVQPAATDARLYSVLCMSCHDGVTTQSVIGPTSTKAVGNPTSSFGLQNDHPINMTYDTVQDPGLQALASVTAAGLKLFGANNSMQCASCHDVHNNANTKFMRTSNTGSGLCLTCHR
jgi:predicted CXXCH cytochrome family protein